MWAWHKECKAIACKSCPNPDHGAKRTALDSEKRTP
jgi:hypothetical protein